MADNIIGAALLVALGYSVTQRNLVEAFFEYIDLGHNLQIARRWVKKQSGWPAAILGVAFTFAAWACGQLAYRFDLMPTWEYGKWVAGFLADNQATQDSLAFTAFSITMLPTIIEMAAVGLGKDGLKMVEYLVFLFAGLDVITDWPDAARLVDGWMAKGMFRGWPGWLHFAGEWTVKGLWTVMASFGFEMLTVVFAASAVMLFLVALPEGKGTRATTAAR